MIILSHRFFIAREHWAGFEECCRGHAGSMTGASGCYHRCLVRGSDGGVSHVLHSIWGSLEAFQAWSRSHAWVPAEPGDWRGALYAPVQVEIQIYPLGDFPTKLRLANSGRSWNPARKPTAASPRAAAPVPPWRPRVRNGFSTALPPLVLTSCAPLD